MGRTLFYCADVKTRVSSFWGFTKRELSKKRAMSSKWDSTFSFVKEHGFSFFFLSRVGKISFFIVKDLGNLLFSVSRLWKISLLDCQVLWVQYRLGLHLRSTSTVLYVYLIRTLCQVHFKKKKKGFTPTKKITRTSA